MILTVEVPRGAKPRCWFAFDEEDFVRKVKIGRPSPEGVVFAAASPRQLLAAPAPAAATPAAPASSSDVERLAAEHGWDTPLYRADYLLAPGIYQAEEVSEFVAHVALLAHDTETCRVYLDEEQAMDALMQDPLYAGREGFYAHMALREQLIALEVLADDN